MNSKVIASKKRVYHTNANAEFTGFYEGMTYPTQITSAIFDYHLFIKYGDKDKVYMEVKGVGEVVIPFEALKKTSIGSTITTCRFCSPTTIPQSSKN